MAKQERIMSAVHIINALKSVNDTSLSDWQGVIGDELEQQREEKLEKEEELRDLIAGVQALLTAQQHKVIGISDDSDELRDKIERIHRDLRQIASQTGGVPIKRPRTVQKRRVDVENVCPDCQAVLRYRQRAKQNSSKAVECDKCNARFISRYHGDESFTIEPRMDIEEEYQCPFCHTLCNVMLDMIPSATVVTPCSECGELARVTRAISGLRISGVGAATPKVISEDIIVAVEAQLPEQPWPKHIHKKVGIELKLANSVVQRAIQELIRRKKFKQQVGGKLYVEEQEIE